MANDFVSEMLSLAASDEPINIYINSPGGSVTAGMAIYDTMQYIKCDVSTICIGMAASMGAFLLAGGAKGKRYALPNAEIMIHQPLGGMQGQATDIQIHAERKRVFSNLLLYKFFVYINNNCGYVVFDVIYFMCQFYPSSSLN